MTKKKRSVRAKARKSPAKAGKKSPRPRRLTTERVIEAERIAETGPLVHLSATAPAAEYVREWTIEPQALATPSPARRPGARILTESVPAGLSSPDMDPRLQWKIASVRQHRRHIVTAATSPEEVAVVARVSDLDAFTSMSEVRIGTVIAGTNQDGSIIATARIPASRAEFVRQQPCVLSLKAAQRVWRTLHETTRETEADPTLVPSGSHPDGGAGVVVGVVDFGCDFMHRNFRDAGQQTRLVGIWDQAASPTPTSPFGYGTFHDAAAIDAALTSNDPYAKLGYGPEVDQRGTHGTHVMDIAAGNGLGTTVPGMAPSADLLFVEVSASDVPWEGPDVVGKNFGDSVQLLEAVQFIFEHAGDRPCVVNVSLGTNGGPHDGTTLVEQALDRLVSQRPNRAVVIAASNSHADGIHASGTVAPGGTAEIRWDVAANDPTDNEIEVWYAGTDRFVAELLAPDGSVVTRVEPGATRHLTLDGQLVGLVANRLDDPNNHDNMIGIFLDPRMPAGTWGLRLVGQQVEDGTFHAWIERDDRGQSNFTMGRVDSHTIGSVSCGRETIVVGSYDAHVAALPLSWFSSAGPTRDGREKPEVSAPGHNVLAARSRSGTGSTLKSGTSMAAPAVTGMVALVLGAALRAGKSLTTQTIRSIVMTSARRTPPSGQTWDPRYGLGRISVVEALKVLAAIP